MDFVIYVTLKKTCDLIYQYIASSIEQRNEALFNSLLCDFINNCNSITEMAGYQACTIEMSSSKRTMQSDNFINLFYYIGGTSSNESGIVGQLKLSSFYIHVCSDVIGFSRCWRGWKTSQLVISSVQLNHHRATVQFQQAIFDSIVLLCMSELRGVHFAIIRGGKITLWTDLVV